MTRTKLSAASRYGPRYGSTLKKKIKDIEETQRKKQVCPQCNRRSLKRKEYGIWKCTKCRAKIAGGAYTPRTPDGLEAKRIVKREEKAQEKAEELQQETENE